MAKRSIAEIIRELRKIRDLKQPELAANAKIDLNTLQSIEYEKTLNPTVETLINLSTALGVSVGYLVGAPTAAEEKAELLLTVITALPALDEQKLRLISQIIDADLTAFSRIANLLGIKNG